MDVEQVVKLRERLLQCAVCMDEYRDPRILPCHHTLCLECIESVINSSSATGRYFRCPQCRADVAVPRGGTAELPINFYIISLQDELGVKGYTGSCDICQRDWISAQFRCVDCDIDICRFCIHTHRLETHTEPPKVIRIESGSSSSSHIKCCPEHVDENCQLFCSTCKQAICVICSCGDHKYHKVVPINVQLEETTKYLQSELDKLLAEKRNAQKVGELIQMLKQDMITNSEQTAEDLRESAEKACKFITDWTTDIEAVIKSRSEQQAEEFEEIKRDYKSYLQQIDKGVNFLQDLQKSDVCLEVVDAYKNFSSQLNSAKRKFTSNHITIQVSDFTPCNTTKMFSFNVIDKHCYHLGKLGTFSENKYCITFDHKSLEPHKHHKGVASLMKRRSAKIIARAILAFIIFQLIMYIATATGMWDWLAFMANKLCAHIYSLFE